MYRCVMSFGGQNEDGSPNGCIPGDILPEDHPLVKGNPTWFVPVEPDLPERVEQATAAPGERRGEVS